MVETAFEILPQRSSTFVPVKIAQGIHNPGHFLFTHRNGYSNAATIFDDSDNINLFSFTENVEGFISDKDKPF